MKILISLFLFFAALQISVAESISSVNLTEGKFGKTFEYRKNPKHWISTNAMAEYQKYPLTIECWVKNAHGGNDHNVFMALESRENTGHWSLYIPRWGSDNFTVYSTRSFPYRFASSKAIDPAQWHYCAVVFTDSIIKIFVDGKETNKTAITNNENIRTSQGLIKGLPNNPKLYFGTDMMHILNGHLSNGLVDEIRISKIARDIKGIPDKPFESDQNTVGLWHFDEIQDNGFKDESSKANDAKITEIPKISLDEIDRISYAPKIEPLKTPCKEIKLKQGKANIPSPSLVYSLDGKWDLAEDGEDNERLIYSWIDAVPAEVPGSVHNALFKAGLLPDPTVGKNMMLARDKSYKNHWYRKVFTRPKNMTSANLNIDGICESYLVWLNGTLLGEHTGKYIPHSFDISKNLKDTNTIIIKLKKANRKLVYSGGYWNDGPSADDVDVPATFGWHYANMPLHGIWKSISITENHENQIVNTFVATENAEKGIVHLLFDIRNSLSDKEGTIVVEILPENFEGKSFNFSEKISLKGSENSFHYKLNIPDPQLWWPNGMGEPNLYRLRIAFIPTSGKSATNETTFGIRTIETKPLNNEKIAYNYNWIFCINGKPLFLKGANWTPIDVYLNMKTENYERFIQLAKDQNINFLRSWGAGIHETPAFFELCDRYGIMVSQELIDGGHYEIGKLSMEAFIRQTRSHPSLIMYTGGNEVDIPFNEHVQTMGRLALELDGTRNIQRTDPWGGSLHQWSFFWGNAPLEFNLQSRVPFIGEFGFTSQPNFESVQRYLPENEKMLWPPSDKGSFAFHSPAFNRDANYGRDMSHMTYYAKQIMSINTMQDFITGTQLIQATGYRITMEQFRADWPKRTGICYYKFNEFVPAASYSVVDWYGNPKLSHYFAMDAYEPLHACMIAYNLNPNGKKLSAKIALCDDADALKNSNWEIRVRAFDSSLKKIENKSFSGKGSINKVDSLGVFELTESQTGNGLILVVTEVIKDDKLADRTFYWLNYENNPGSLMNLPKTTLSLNFKENKAIIKNTGDVPAVAVYFDCPDISDKFRAEDNFFWLEPNETKEVKVNTTLGIKVRAWNTEK